MEHRALLLLLDGCRPDALLASDAPNLKKIAFEGGAFSFHVNCGGLPLSAPCWASILTGVPQKDHQVMTNDLDAISLDEQGHVTVSPIPECVCKPSRGPLCAIFQRGKSQSAAVRLPATLFERLAKEGRRSALFTVGSWEGVGRLSGAPPGAREAHVGQSLLSVRHFNCSLDDEWQSTADAVKAVGEHLADNDNCPHMLVVYLHLIDGNGHKHGFGFEVPEYRSAIQAVDVQVGKLIDAVRTRATKHQEDWMLAVTTDHGGTAQRRMPRGMQQAFADCGCVQLGIDQLSLAGIHGLRELPQHTQTFQMLGMSQRVQSGEMLPAPEPEDLVPTLLQHLVGETSNIFAGHELRGKVRGLLPVVPPVPMNDAEDAAKESPAKLRRISD